MKRLILMILGWISFLLSFGFIKAAQSVRYEMGMQYPWTKNFYITLQMFPAQDIQKIVIKWDKNDLAKVSPATSIIEIRHVTTVEKRFKITPLSKGKGVLHASVTYYSGTSTYVESVDVPVEFNSYLRMPPTPTYYTYLLLFYLGIFVLGIILVYAGYKVCKYVCYELIPRWIKKKAAQPI